MTGANAHFPGRYWQPTPRGQIVCQVCPRLCALREGQRGLCFVRKREGDKIVLTTYGRSSGFVIDPVEKKPLNHFFPGTSVLSFGTAGCNLACKFCQNWDISKSRAFDRLQSQADPEALADASRAHHCQSLAFTYNDPVIFLEYAVDVARACRERQIETIAVTAGYITDEARPEFFRHMTATNIDLKAFSENFYAKVTAGHLEPVLDTLRYVRHETDVWMEITTLLIPGLNDDDEELKRLCQWLLAHIGPEVPLHFSAFHPDFKMVDRPSTPKSTLIRAQRLARTMGLKHVYTGNVHHEEGDTTRCAQCDHPLIVRDWYEILTYNVQDGACPACGHPLAGRFANQPGRWGRKRLPIVV